MVAILNCLGVWRRYWRSNLWVASWGYLGRSFQAEKGWGLRASEEVPEGRGQQRWVTGAAAGHHAARVCGQGHNGPELSPASGIWVRPSPVSTHTNHDFSCFESHEDELRTFLNGFLLLSPFSLHESNSFWVQIIGTLWRHLLWPVLCVCALIHAHSHAHTPIHMH